MAKKIGTKAKELALYLEFDFKEISQVKENNSVYTEDDDLAYSILEVTILTFFLFLWKWNWL